MESYKNFAMRIAQEAGVIMKEHFGLGTPQQEKPDITPVTEADLRINALLIREVAALFPSHSVLGEEESFTVQGSEYTWVCDPLDGTIPYASGLPLSVFSLALVKDGEVVLGVVHDPFCDRLYVAEKGMGTTLNGKPIHVSRTHTLVRSKIAYEMWNRAKYDMQEVVKRLKMHDVFLMKLSAYVNPSALVAAGEFTATIFPNDTPHDAAAVKIIVEEAGGKVTDLFGNDQRYDQPINGLIVSNGLVHEELVELVKHAVVLQESK